MYLSIKLCVIKLINDTMLKYKKINMLYQGIYRWPNELSSHVPQQEPQSQQPYGDDWSPLRGSARGEHEGSESMRGQMLQSLEQRHILQF